jgi:hypothetical protein
MRAMLRLWRDYLARRWPYWPVDAAISYALPGKLGNLYRFDGWRKVGQRAPSGGRGTWSGRPAAAVLSGPKTLYVYDYQRAGSADRHPRRQQGRMTDDIAPLAVGRDPPSLPRAPTRTRSSAPRSDSRERVHVGWPPRAIRPRSTVFRRCRSPSTRLLTVDPDTTTAAARPSTASRHA